MSSFDWIYPELNKLLLSPPNDSYIFDPDYLHLRNPNAEKIIDEIFYKTFLPEIENAFNNSPFIIYKGENYPGFETKISSRLIKSFTLLIEDPQRPFELGALNKTWYSRFELEIGKNDFMLLTDLHLYFPIDFDINKILQLMRNPYFEGLPPQLSCDDRIFTLEFHKGTGASWGLESYEAAANNISKRIIQMQKILKFMNENDLSIEKNFTKLENYLVTYFDNW
jgi:hypothetical protein